MANWQAQSYMNSAGFMSHGRVHSMKDRESSRCGRLISEMGGRPVASDVTCKTCLRSERSEREMAEWRARRFQEELDAARAMFAKDRPLHSDAPWVLALAKAAASRWRSPGSVMFVDSDHDMFRVSIKWLTLRFQFCGDVLVECVDDCRRQDRHELALICEHEDNGDSCPDPFACAARSIDSVDKVVRQHMQCFDYRDYLSSERWRRTRARILKRDGFRCQYPNCDHPRGLEVHHITYARIGAEHDDDLVTLCWQHHRVVEGER